VSLPRNNDTLQPSQAKFHNDRDGRDYQNAQNDDISDKKVRRALDHEAETPSRGDEFRRDESRPARAEPDTRAGQDVGQGVRKEDERHDLKSGRAERESRIDPILRHRAQAIVGGDDDRRQDA
jgi:hypothetical protein